jgi:predicted nucleotidyltransferase
MNLGKDQILIIVRDILEKYGSKIKFAYLFGSYSTGQEDEYSDIDIGIFFDRNTSDEIRNSIRFEIMDALEPFKVDICYLDDEEISPEIFLAATDGIPIVINDEDSLYEGITKNIHRLEELRLIGIRS